MGVGETIASNTPTLHPPLFPVFLQQNKQQQEMVACRLTLLLKR